MQKWEYLRVLASAEKNVTKACWVNGKELRDWKKGPPIMDFLNMLGDEGWELIAPTGGVYYLKRQKS